MPECDRPVLNYGTPRRRARVPLSRWIGGKSVRLLVLLVPLVGGVALFGLSQQYPPLAGGALAFGICAFMALRCLPVRRGIALCACCGLAGIVVAVLHVTWGHDVTIVNQSGQAVLELDVMPRRGRGNIAVETMPDGAMANSTFYDIFFDGTFDVGGTLADGSRVSVQSREGSGYGGSSRIVVGPAGGVRVIHD